MSQRRVMLVVAGAVLCGAPLGVIVARAPSAVAFATSRAWSKAIEVPGLGALNARGHAAVISVSCPSAGNCAAGGYYRHGFPIFEAFVVDERNGRWHRAIEVPGSAALSAGGAAVVDSVSCASAGNCAAGGYYSGASGQPEAFVVDERNGRWRRAIKVPGLAALNVGHFAQVLSVSCASAGNCAAGGTYSAGSGHGEAFVVDERNGRWRRAIEVPGSGALNAGGGAAVISVSCASAGNCAAGGTYTGRSHHFQVFVVDERNGRWQRAIEVPGSGALNVGHFANLNSVSCAQAGNCAAGGTYAAGSGHSDAFVVDERNGRWRRAIEVPGSAALNTGGFAVVNSVSCAQAGNCAAGGIYVDESSHLQAFVVDQRNGRWHRAIEVPGSGALNAGGVARVLSVSCASAGNCAAGGDYTGSSGNHQAFVVTERNGRWHPAIKVPGSAALNAGGNAEVNSVSCASASNCAAGGSYRDGLRHFQGFVVNRT